STGVSLEPEHAKDPMVRVPARSVMNRRFEDFIMDQLMSEIRWALKIPKTESWNKASARARTRARWNWNWNRNRVRGVGVIFVYDNHILHHRWFCGDGVALVCGASISVPWVALEHPSLAPRGPSWHI